MRYIITCQSCGSSYHAEGIDNCKQCGSPVAVKDCRPEHPIREVVVPLWQHESPMTIRRRDDFFGNAIFYASQTIGGQRYGSAIQVSECMMMDSNFDLKEYIERKFRIQIAEVYAREMPVQWQGAGI